jgi:hypothetical protein
MYCPVLCQGDLVDSKTIPGFEWMSDVPRLRPEDLVYMGLRDVDLGEVGRWG